MAASPHSLVLTDVVGSTRLAAALGDDRNAALWQQHDALARRLVAAWGGHELERTDGLLIRFDDPIQALEFARGYLHALAQLDPPLPARVAIHRPLEHQLAGAHAVLGAVQALTPEGHVVAVRSAVPRDVGDEIGPIELLGTWCVEGSPEPVELVEVFAPEGVPCTLDDIDLAYQVTPHHDAWLPVRDIPQTLPAEWDPFVGRSDALAALRQALDEGARLVTLTGTGGSGKTRLVCRYGRRHLAQYPGGVWFCDLSEAADAERLAFTVARALDVSLGGADPIQELGAAIRDRGRCLVILDNFEQLAPHARRALVPWLSLASQARFLVTSREVLGVPGEEVLSLSPLSESDAVRLFATRAAAAAGVFLVSPSNRDDVLNVVRLLDCLPLAIELAAARVRVMSPAELASRMSERFKLLRGKRADGRHATLRATFDWSWELLSPEEQRAFAQLSAFEGGFTLDDAEVVLHTGEAWSADLVQSLSDKSLVRRVAGDRFQLLASAQAYAAERLQDPERADTEVRHGAHFAARGTEEALTATRSAGGEQLLRALTLDLHNLTAACRRAVARGDAAVALPTLRAAWVVVGLAGPTGLGAALAEQVQAMPALAPPHRAYVHVVQGHVAWRQGHNEAAVERYRSALEIFEAIDDRNGEARMLGNLGELCRVRGDTAQARHFLTRARERFRALGDRRDEASVTGYLAGVLYTEGDLTGARDMFEWALEALREIGDRQYEGLVLGNLGYVQYQMGDFAAARATYHAAIDRFRDLGARRLVGITLGNLARLCAEEGEPDDAERHYQAALEILREVSDPQHEAMLTGNLADLYRDRGAYDQARAHYEVALKVHRESSEAEYVCRVLGGIGNLCRLLGHLDDAERHYEEARGMYEELGNHRGEGVMRANLGSVLADRGRTAEATSHWDHAVAALRAVGDRLWLAKVLAGRAAYEADWEREVALEHLREAEAIASDLGVAAEGALGMLIREAHEALSGRSVAHRSL